MKILRRIRSALGLRRKREPDLTAGDTELSRGGAVRQHASERSTLKPAVTEPNGRRAGRD